MKSRAVGAASDRSIDAEARFFELISENPSSALPKLLYADWLANQGECVRSEIIRLAEAFRTEVENTTRRRVLERRLYEIVKNVDRNSELEFWILQMKYYNEYIHWRSPISEDEIGFDASNCDDTCAVLSVRRSSSKGSSQTHRRTAYRV